MIKFISRVSLIGSKVLNLPCKRVLKICVGLLVTILFVGQPVVLRGDSPGCKLAFLSDRNDPGQRTHLWVIDSDLNNLRQLTTYESPYRVYTPIFSYDKNWIVFKKEDNPNMYRSEVWKIDITGNDLVLVNDPGSGKFSHSTPLNWSPDDGTVLLSSEQSNHNGWFKLWQVNSDGSGGWICCNNGNAPFGEYSPDGNRIVYAYSSNYNRPSEIRVKDSDCVGNDTQLIGAYEWPSNYGPVHNILWLSQNKLIFSIGPYNGSYDIYTFDLLSSTYELLVDTGGDDRFARYQTEGKTSLLFNGSKLVFYSNVTGNYEIYIINTDKTGLRQLTFNSAENKYPAFSPDGSKIFWISNQSGTYSIWMMDVDGGNQTQVTDDAGNETEFTIGAVLNPPCVKGIVARDTVGNEYSCATIQDAVDMAGEGWEIEVGAGSYDESVFVKKKTGVTIISRCNAVVNGGFKLIQSTNVTIEGFIIDAAGTNNDGIILKGGTGNSNTTIQNCEIYNADKNRSGIVVALGNPNTLIKDNYIHDNGRNGIMFINASGGPHFITGNTIEANGWNGVMVPRKHEVTLTGNTITRNGVNSRLNREHGYGVKRGRVPGKGWPEGITLIDNIIKCNMGTIEEGKSSSDLGTYQQMLDPTDSGNCTTAGDEGTGTTQCGEGC